jgi:Matrixin
VLARLIVCAALVLAAVPAAAMADDVEPPPIPVPAADGLMTTAHGLAVARWGMDPCGGQVAMSWQHMGAGINARSQWMSIYTNDPSTYSDCSITYNLDVDWDWPKLCTVVEHELGHLSGHDHVNDPHDVMSPYYVYAAPECALPKTATVAPDRSPRSVTSSKKASSARRSGSKRKSAKKKRASAAAKRKSASKRKNASRRKSASKRKASTKKSDASLDAPFFDWVLPLLPA